MESDQNPKAPRQRDAEMESMLDALGARDRAEPDAGFESRVAADAKRSHRRTPGRRRLLFVGPAALTGLAALIAVGVILLPAAPVTPVARSGSSDADLASIAEMSFTLFDDTFGLDAVFADADTDSTVIDPASLDDWFVDGDSL